MGDTVFYLSLAIPVFCGLATVVGSIYRIQTLMIAGFAALLVYAVVATAGSCFIIAWHVFIETLRHTLHFIMKKMGVI